MFRAIAFSIAIITGTAAGAENRPVAVPPGDYVKTCSYFEARMFGPANERGAWIALLSDSCAEALRRMGEAMADGKRPGVADADYLERLTNLRQVVTELNVARFTRNHKSLRRTGIRRSVSDSGEYLIARSIGVMASFTTWAEAADYQIVALPID